jgi:hypothetical protein
MQDDTPRSGAESAPWPWVVFAAALLAAIALFFVYTPR